MSSSSSDAPPGRRRAARPGKTAAASLRDVAARAEVSTATVSRVINGTSTVSAAVRERVREACAALGYIPNGMARALSSRRTHTIGAVVPTIENEGFARTIFTLQRAVQEAGFGLLFANSDYDPDVEMQVVLRLVSQGIDGLMLVGGEHRPQLLKLLRAKKIPFVEAWTLAPAAACVGFDNVLAAERLADYLLGLGHRRIAMVAGHAEYNDRAAARLLGVRRSLRKHGLDLHAQYVTRQPYRIVEGEKGAESLLADGQDAPTAIVCGNDQLAFGVLAQARRMNIIVPAQLSVTGFGDYDYAQFLDPPLTTMHIPAEDIGSQAASYLLARIAGRRAARTQEVGIDLIIRATTAPPLLPGFSLEA